MDQNVLTIAFVIFVIFVIVLALVLRRRTVDDIFSDDKAASFSDTAFSNKARDVLPSAPKNKLTSAPMATLSSGGMSDSTSIFTRENINKLGKALTAIGAVMIFAPLPDALDGVGFGVAFLGYILANATKSKKTTQKNKRVVSSASPVNALRKLAGKPEYQQAMNILSADMADKNLITDSDRHDRAVRYLESKGVSTKEANQNVKAMANYLAQQNNK